jgi:hypothetical protein
MESYQPDPNVVAIKASQPETTITVALATWCSTKQHATIVEGS